MRRLILVVSFLALFAAGCGLSVELDASDTTTDNGAGVLATTAVEPETSAELQSTTLVPAPTTTMPAPHATTTTEPEPEFLPTPDPITEAPPGAGDWGDIIVSIESFWDDEFSEFAGGGTYQPLDRDRIVGVRDDDERLPNCDRADISAQNVEDNAFAVTCREGQLVVWDDDDLFAELVREYGDTGPAIVLAHELGHSAQFQAGVLRRTSSVIIEQQADCLAGSFASWAADRGVPPFNTPESLDAAVGATVSFRDQPGSSRNNPNAHGSGFDRVRAFQDGFDRGVSFCAGYPDTPPPITEIGFTADEFITGGNMSFDLLIETVTPYFNDFFAAQIDNWIELSPTPDELSSWRREHLRVGDNATGTRLAMLFAARAQELLGLESEGDGAILQQACAAGGVFEPLFFELDNSPEDLRLSAGDLDEAVITLSRLVEASPDIAAGFLFELVATLRLGFTDGIEACGLA